ncbi:MAG: hypothetical protein WCS96_13815 [Victivallales bacterium]
MKINMLMKKLLLCLATVLVSGVAMAETKPFNLSLTPDVAVYPRTDTIEGLTLSVWGENQQTSLALGIANGTVGDSAGLSWGFILDYADKYKGIQWAAINYTKDSFLGWQSGFVDYTWGTMMGLQAGVVNYAGRVTGLEFGIVNYTEDVDAGLQIGIVNIVRNNKSWFSDLPNSLAPAMIFVNW